MALSPIAYIAINYSDYSTQWLKAYEPGTTTPKAMSLDSAGPPAVAKLQLNADGFLVSAGNALVIPYIDGSYDLWLFPTEADADANDTANAIQIADDITGALTQEGVDLTLVSNLNVAYEFPTVALMVASTIAFPSGKPLRVLDLNTDYIVTGGASSMPISSPNIGGGGYALLNVSGLMDLTQFGGVANGSYDNKAAIEEAGTVTNAITLREGVYNFSAAPTLPTSFNTIIYSPATATGVTSLELKSMNINNGVLMSYPNAPELAGKNIEIISGTIRQEAPVSVTSITSSGTTATVTQAAHGYANGDKVDIRGVNNSDSLYNGIFTISNVTATTYTYTLAVPLTSPAPSTAGITAHRPAIWNWIKDSLHEPIGVDDSSPIVAVGSSITIPFTKTYSRVLSFIANGDETLSNALAFTCGTSVGLSAATIKANINLTLASDIYWNGSIWVAAAGIGQGSGGFPINIRDITYAAGTLVVNHEWIQGKATTIDPFGNGGTIIPYLPIHRSFGTNFVAVNFMDSFTTLYTSSESTKLSCSISRIFSGGTNLDGSDNSTPSLRMYNGNIWFFGIMEV